MFLFEDPKYFSFLASTHPELRISLNRFEVPTFIASPNIGEFIIRGQLKRFFLLSGRLCSRIRNPATLFIGSAFEPYEQSNLLKRIRSPVQATGALFDLAKDRGLDIVVLTNVSAKDPELLNWKEAGFRIFPSFPDMLVPIQTDSFESHAAALAPKVRESIRRNLRLFERSGHRLERIRSSEEYGSILYAAYKQFGDRAIVQWHSHTPDYFSKLADLDEQVHLTLVKSKAGETLGFVVTFSEGPKWHVGRMGIVPDKYRKDAIYFRMLYHCIEEAIANGAKTVSLQPTAFRVKRRLGALYRPMVNLVLGVSPMWRMLLATTSTLGRYSLSYLQDFQKLEALY